MSNAMTEKSVPPSFDADDIIAWLRKNPDFLDKNPDACDLLFPPTRKDNDRKVTDFQSFMIKRLREDKDEVIEATREIVENSRANMNNQARIHNAVLMLLEATSFDDFVRTITMDCATLLDVDIVSLVVEIDSDVIPHIDLTGVRVVPSGTIHLLTKGQNAVLESNISGLDEIYGGGAGLVKSQLLMRLDISRHAPPAIVAFGSRDPNHFQPGQGTDQIGFLGGVIERCFRTWLSLPI